jgi:hypothetical protein
MRTWIAGIGMACTLGIASSSLADPTQTVYPPKQSGPVAMVISGASASLYGLYHDFTKALADKGYYAVLLYGNEILRREGGREALESAIGRARQAAASWSACAPSKRRRAHAAPRSSSWCIRAPSTAST